MINTNRLRQEYRRERQENDKSALIGAWVLIVLGVVFGSMIMGLLIRGMCSLIVIINKGGI